jgi:hypothetical protein
LQGSGKRSLAYLAAAILLAGVLVSATLLLAPLSRPPTTVTITPTVSTVTTTTTLSTIPSSVTNLNASIDCDATLSHANYVPPTDDETAIPYSAGGSANGTDYQCERVLVIPPGVPPGSTGKLVVWYETNLNAWDPPSDGGSDLANLTAAVVAPVFSTSVPGQVERFTSVPGITVTPSIPSVNVTDYANATSFDVTYTINVSDLAQTGFYLLEYLGACPNIIPLAVGYNVSQLNEYSFSYYNLLSQGCTTMLSMFPGGTLVSVSGIQLAWMVQADESNVHVEACCLS